MTFLENIFSLWIYIRLGRHTRPWSCEKCHDQKWLLDSVKTNFFSRFFTLLYCAVLCLIHIWSTGKETLNRYMWHILIWYLFGFGHLDCCKGSFFGVVPWTSVVWSVNVNLPRRSASQKSNPDAIRGLGIGGRRDVIQSLQPCLIVHEKFHSTLKYKTSGSLEQWDLILLVEVKLILQNKWARLGLFRSSTAMAARSWATRTTTSGRNRR